MGARFGRKQTIAAREFEAKMSALADDLIAKVKDPLRAHMRAMDDLAEAAESAGASEKAVDAIIEATSKRINDEIYATW